MEFSKKVIFKTILSYACELGNTELIKYFISLNKFDINSKMISV